LPVPRYSEREDQYLRRYYPYQPVKVTAQKMGKIFGVHRSRAAVQQHAASLGLSNGTRPGWVRVSDITPDEGAKAAVIVAAKRDGVLERPYPGAKNIAMLVPETWADEYLKMRLERAEVESRGWLTTQQVADLYGIAPSFVRRSARGMVPLHWGLAKRLAMVEIDRGEKGHLRYEPESLRRAMAGYKPSKRHQRGGPKVDEQAQAGGWWTKYDLAKRLGRAVSYVSSGKKRSWLEKRIQALPRRKGFRCCYYEPYSCKRLVLDYRRRLNAKGREGADAQRRASAIERRSAEASRADASRPAALGARRRPQVDCDRPGVT